MCGFLTADQRLIQKTVQSGKVQSSEGVSDVNLQTCEPNTCMYKISTCTSQENLCTTKFCIFRVCCSPSTRLIPTLHMKRDS